jgi:hypothetical protein
MREVCTCGDPEEVCPSHVRVCRKCQRAGDMVDAGEHSDREHDAYMGTVKSDGE